MSKPGLNNPALIAAVVQNPVLIKKGISAASLLALTVVGITVGYVSYKGYVRHRRNSFLNENFDKTEVQQGLLLHKALIGELGGDKMSFLNLITPIALVSALIPNNTDEDLVYKTLNEITDFEAVAEAYKKMSGRNLIEDLESELSSDEYKKALGVRNDVTTYNNQQTQGYETLQAFKKGDKIRVINPKGASVYNFSIENGLYKKTTVKKVIPYAEEFEIHHVLNNSDASRIHYIICTYGIYFGRCTGDVLINHRDVKTI